MKNIIQRNNMHNLKIGHFNTKKPQADIIDFRPDKNHHYILKLKINNIDPDNYRLIFDQNQLTVIIFESIEFNNPVHIRNYKLHDLYKDQSYEEIKSFDLTLPEQDFYLIGHSVIPKKRLLKVIFGKLNYN